MAAEEIYQPVPADEDAETYEQMSQGRLDLDGDNALFDPFFKSAEEALAWENDNGV